MEKVKWLEFKTVANFSASKTLISLSKHLLSRKHLVCQRNTSSSFKMFWHLCFFPPLHLCTFFFMFFTSLRCTPLLTFHLSFLSSPCHFRSSLLPLDNIRQYLPVSFDTVTLSISVCYCQILMTLGTAPLHRRLRRSLLCLILTMNKINFYCC